MSGSGSKILLLSLPGDAEALGRQLARALSSTAVSHEFLDVAPSCYEAILDRLEGGALPVILKSRRERHS